MALRTFKAEYSQLHNKPNKRLIWTQLYNITHTKSDMDFENNVTNGDELKIKLQHLLKILIDHKPAGFEISRRDKSSGKSSGSCFWIKNKNLCDDNSRTLFANNVYVH